MSKILFCIVVFLANIIQGITGFAGTILAMPFAIHLVGYPVAKPVLNLLGVLASGYMLLRGYRNVNVKQLKRVVLFMTIGIGIGLILKHYISGHEKIMYMVLGIFVIFIGARGLISFAKYVYERNTLSIYRCPHKFVSTEQEEYIEKGHTLRAMANLVVAGMVHGVFVSGGPLIVSYLSNHTKSKEEFVRTVSAVWVILNSIVFISDFAEGYYTTETWKVQLQTIPFLFGGMVVGGFLYKHMSQTFFTILTYILLCIAGASLLVK